MSDKKLLFITYILSKNSMAEKHIIEKIYNMDKTKFLQVMVILNPYSFFNIVAYHYIKNRDWKKSLQDFDISYIFKKSSKKDAIYLKRLFDQELISLALFYENYLVFNLPLTIENIEFFKKDKNKKIYRYKQNVLINDKIYSIKDIFLNRDKEKMKMIEKEYRMEKNILLNI